MNEDRLWLLVSLQLSGEATPEELEELNNLLQQHPEKHLQVEIVRNMWKKEATGNEMLRNNSYDRHLQRLSNHLSEPVLQYEPAGPGEGPTARRSRGIVRRLLIGGSIAASLLVVFLLYTRENRWPQKQTEQVAGNTVSTRPGSKSHITLPDGTQVWINADSRITYDQHFSGEYREVHLSGEAYFDVAHDSARPFIIHTRSVDVRVLGTAFNIRSYPNEKTTETALIRGSVEVTLHNNPDKKIILKPNEKLVVNNNMLDDSVQQVANNWDNEPMLTLSKVRYARADSSASVEVMWVKNKLAFENETFERMVQELERWYNVRFLIKNEKLKWLRFYGVFENKSLDEVLQALSISGEFHYEIKGSEVTVW
jgi:Fe2+-dicitrate sensor, membrane component